MIYSGIQDFLRTSGAPLARGPVALIFAEDATEVETTLRHHWHQGFARILLFASDRITLPEDLAKHIPQIRWSAPEGIVETVNTCIAAAPGIWFYYGYNAEYLFYPFCETRTVGELLTFHSEERRSAMLTYVLDLYAGDLETHPAGVDLDGAWLDRSGYYALARSDPETGERLERQLDFFGGLRWRFEEHIPWNRRRIDRIGLFKAKPGLTLSEDHLFSDPEYNTYACPWHHNLTASVASFRTAKALKRNPGSTFEIQRFRWHNSVQFEWHSAQLLELGLMESGQWF